MIVFRKYGCCRAIKKCLKPYGISFLSVFLACALGADESGDWIIGITAYRTCVFVWVPLFLLGITVLEKGMHLYTQIRLIKRRNIFRIQVAQLVFFAVSYFVLWLGIQLLFSAIVYGNLDWLDVEWWTYMGQWFLGLLLLSVVELFFSQFQKDSIALNGGILTYAIYVVDVMVLTPMADQQLPMDFHFCFTRMFVPSSKNVVILCVMIAAMVLVAGKMQERKDIGI